MTVTQVYSILNNITKEIIGDSVVVAEDLSNVVDVGSAIMSTAGGLDNYVKALPDHVGRMVFVDRVYAGRAPSVLMDGWEFGSILEKVRAEMPEAEENETWELQDRASYDVNVFYKPKVHAKFFNKRVTFEIPISITDKQAKSSFDNPTQMNAFFSMIYTAIDNSMTVKTDALIMRTINAAIGETLHDNNSARAVNLLALYNDAFGTSLTPAQAILDPAFIRYASYIMKRYAGRLANMSRLFNIGGTDKFTPADRLKCVLLDDFKAAAEVYLYDANGQMKDENLKLPAADGVAFWQGSGTSYAFADVSKIDIKTPSGDDVTQTGIIGVMFDRDALGVTNYDRRTTTNYNAKAEFTNLYSKADAGYFIDLDENFVVFYMAA